MKSREPGHTDEDEGRSKRPGATGLRPRRKQPRTVPRLEPGPAQPSGAALIGWLEANPDQGLLRLPIRIERSGHFQPRKSWIGHTPSPGARVNLDDGAMGLSLAERIRQHCGEAPVCHLWIDGFWGPTIPMPMLEPKPTFSTRWVEGEIPADQREALVFFVPQRGLGPGAE